MDPITVGMTVRSLDDQTIGRVTGVHPCCVRFALKDSTQSASATWAGVFNCQVSVVSLIYVAREAHRYTCVLHSSTPEAVPARSVTGWPVAAGPSSQRRTSIAGSKPFQFDNYWGRAASPRVPVEVA